MIWKGKSRKGKSMIWKVNNEKKKYYLESLEARTHPKVLLNLEDVLKGGLGGAARVLSQAADGGRVRLQAAAATAQLGAPFGAAAAAAVTTTAQLGGPLATLALFELQQPVRKEEGQSACHWLV